MDNPYETPTPTDDGPSSANPIDLSGPLPDFDDLADGTRTLAFQLDAEDLVEWSVFVALKEPPLDLSRRIRSFGLLALLVAVAGGITFYFVPHFQVLTLTGVGILCVIVWFIWRVRRELGIREENAVIHYRKLYRETFAEAYPEDLLRRALARRTLTVSRMGVLTADPWVKTEMKWEAIEDVAAVARACFLMYEGTALIVPRRSFASETDYLDFVRRAAGQVRKARGGGV